MMSEMNDQPQVARKSPYVIDEEPGKKSWCSCGHSGNQPYCDGKHKECSTLRRCCYRRAEKSRLVRLQDDKEPALLRRLP